MAIHRDALERFLRLVEVRKRAVEEAQARIRRRHHCSQGLPHFVGNGSGYSVPRQEPCLTLAALGKHRTEQSRVKRLDLVHEEDEDDAARQNAEKPHRVPTHAESLRVGVIAQGYLYDIKK